MNQPPIIRKAVICRPRDIEDPYLRELALRHCGTDPAWVIRFSRALYALLGESNHSVGLRLVAAGESGQQDVLVLVLQLGRHQLRCVASMHMPLVKQALTAARHRGVVRLIVSDEDGPRFSCYECDVQQDDLDRLALPQTEEVSMGWLNLRLQVIASACLRVDELPSVLAGETVEAAEVVTLSEYEPRRKSARHH